MKAQIFTKTRVLRLLFLLMVACPLRGQDRQSNDKQPTAQNTVSPAEDSDALRKAAQNPVASLISVPIQENWNFGIQPGDRAQNVLNIQPVIPVNVAKDWNLIIRWIAPVDLPTGSRSAGIGFQHQTGYYWLGRHAARILPLSPKQSKVIWGVGPQLLLPTATKTGILGQGKFGLGPTAVLVAQPGKWTLGILATTSGRSRAIPSLPDVNQFFLLQYFINYNLKKGWFLTWQPTIPRTGRLRMTSAGSCRSAAAYGRIMRLGAQPVNVGVQFYGNAVHPPRWFVMDHAIADCLPIPKGAEKEVRLCPCS